MASMTVTDSHIPTTNSCRGVREVAGGHRCWFSPTSICRLKHSLHTTQMPQGKT